VQVSRLLKLFPRLLSLVLLILSSRVMDRDGIGGGIAWLLLKVEFRDSASEMKGFFDRNFNRVNDGADVVFLRLLYNELLLLLLLLVLSPYLLLLLIPVKLECSVG